MEELVFRAYPGTDGWKVISMEISSIIDGIPREDALALAVRLNAVLASPCEHEKVYASYILASNPPLFPWICRKCLMEGTDRGKVHHDEYSVLKERKENI